jgi:methylenetetrahydrofolate dehydrogenase (NADP+)/methenyltetrahydrofolate cyclohydrolase
VTVCHNAADILVIAIGSPLFITAADMVKDGAVVVDVGMNRISHPTVLGKTKLVGDVKFDEVSLKASAITPVSGSAGQMTIAMLLSNTVKSFKLYNSI